MRYASLDTVVPLRLSTHDAPGALADPDVELEASNVTLFSAGVAQPTPGVGVTIRKVGDGLFYADVSLANVALKSSGFFARGKFIEAALTGMTAGGVANLGDWFFGDFLIGEPGDLVGASWRADVTVKRSDTLALLDGAGVTFRKSPAYLFATASSGVASKFLTAGDWEIVGAKLGFEPASATISIDGADAAAELLLDPQGSDPEEAPDMLTGTFIALNDGVATVGVEYRYRAIIAPTSGSYAVNTNWQSATSLAASGSGASAIPQGQVRMSGIVPTAGYEVYVVKDERTIEPAFTFTAPAEDGATVVDHGNGPEFPIGGFLYRANE